MSHRAAALALMVASGVLLGVGLALGFLSSQSPTGGLLLFLSGFLFMGSLKVAASEGSRAPS